MPFRYGTRVCRPHHSLRLLLALLPTLAFSGCAGVIPGAGRPPSAETTTLHGMSIRPERAAYAAGDSVAFIMAYRPPPDPVWGSDGEIRPPGYGEDCDRRLDRWDGAAWEAVPGERWRAHYRAGDAVFCDDALLTWYPEREGASRHPYRLREDAAPGWYRWCTTVVSGGRERWLCSEVFRVRRARRAG